jgi:hypothetical protein
MSTCHGRRHISSAHFSMQQTIHHLNLSNGHDQSCKECLASPTQEMLSLILLIIYQLFSYIFFLRLWLLRHKMVSRIYGVHCDVK